MRGRIAVLLLGLFLPGCLIVDVGVTNPIPGLRTVAVAPFFNLSQEKVVDGRRFAMAYFAELQKVPEFEVVPVGITEQAIFDNQLQMSDPDDVRKLAQILNVDAVAVGAVTDYAPYYPPRVGLKVAWYSSKTWPVVPPAASSVPHERFLKLPKLFRNDGSRFCPPHLMSAATIRSQTPDAVDLLDHWQPTTEAEDAPQPHELFANQPATPRRKPDDSAWELLETVRDRQPSADGREPLFPAANFADSSTSALPAASPFRAPLMSYTRIFDGTGTQLVANLRDFVEVSGDHRSGGWEAYLHRSEDFIRFTSHLMIVEMLTRHGGESRHRFVFKPRKYK